MTGKRILVTAGPCREPIDPVRFISNRSSGRMGFAIAEEALALGASVVLIAGPSLLPAPRGVEFVPVETTREMYEAVASRFAKCDSLIMAAAPADFTPVEVASTKIKKADKHLSLDLTPTVDILKEMGKKKKRQVLVGFALETDNEIENARKKLKEKNLDLIVVNNPREKGAGFEHDTNRVTVLGPGRKADTWPLMAKHEVAAKLLAILSKLI